METFNALAIVFCSYGNPLLRINVGETMEIPTLISVPDYQRVTLRHVDHEDNLPPVGLLFTQSEFNDLIKNQKSYFDESFFDDVFRITNGHVGAIHDFIQIVTSDDSFRESKHAGELYTWDSFLGAFTPKKLLRRLGSTGVFSRGLPPNEALQSSATAGVFSVVLSKNVVTDSDFGTGSERSDALQQCFRNGWLHADKFKTDLQVTGYFFPSSLHRWYVEWKLWGNVSGENFQGARFNANSLLEFVIDAIRLFSPHLLSAERRLGPGCIQRPPEAQYQDELYRCCHTLSEGSLVTFPEFGMAKGRVDFYIPAKRWGIELLRNGDRLASHWSRFSEEGSYTRTISPADYIIVDCRTTRPLAKHTQMSKLYHAVFEDNFTHVRILDNRLCEVKSFPLLRSS
ncbi:hypothetical protein F5887DRAFT_55236 [Amanita rubescens]|nr:hypothetical protein F5887DRAFT_55236 [Amanita rubescens]